MLYVVLPPQWLRDEDPQAIPKQLDCTFDEVLEYNRKGYNVYYYPNPPSEYEVKRFVKASEVDTFNFIFLDLDMKHGAYESKEVFTELLKGAKLPPNIIADSGGGIHAYWAVDDLDAMSFLRLSRRLARLYNTDPAVCMIKQLMRVIGTVNNKEQENPRPTELLHVLESSYTCEQLDSWLPRITQEDEEYCKTHYDRAYSVSDELTRVDDKIPLKFAHLVRNNAEAKEIWSGNVDDRSKGDYRLGHIMFASGFTKDEAMSVLVNSSKALSRAPQHRVSYAENIVDKIWTFEEQTEELTLSQSVRDILSAPEEGSNGTRFPCWSYLDNTDKGFRLGHVIGLVGGSGVGKTAFSLNLFEGFVTFNPNYDHFFISLEQPKKEIADRWKVMCGSNERLYDKVHIIDNYDENGNFRDLSLGTIRDYIIKFKRVTGKQVGCVVIDHIGVLSNEDRLGQDEGVKKLCKQMKAFSVQTNTLLVMQSQTSRDKAGIGDLELNKDAAFGTSAFENYTDFLITIWQPLKRCYDKGAPNVCAFKFCKIRHKKPQDKIKEDVRYSVIFDGDSERLRSLTQVEETSFDFFKVRAANIRSQDRKTELVPYISSKFEQGT